MNLCKKADQSMNLADVNNLSSNALFVLREERELVSHDDFIKDYVLKHPHCHYTTQPESFDQKEHQKMDEKKSSISKLSDA